MSSTRKGMKGIVLPMAFILTLIAAIYVASVLRFSQSDLEQVRSQQNLTQALYLAEAGLNRMAEVMWIGYLNSHPAHRTDWLDDHLEDTSLFQYDADIADTPGTYTTTVSHVYTTDVPSERIAILESIAEVNGQERAVVRAVQYGLGRSPVFDYAYFANNFGWMWGAGITTNGEIRSNGNFSLQNPTINGDIFASVNEEIGADGHVEGSSRHKDIDWYRAHYDSRVRGTTVDGYKHGYDGESEWWEYEEILEMPYLNDISYYEALAAARNGTLRITGGGPSITNVVQGPIVLLGTAQHPIEINGPIVVKGDVLLGGVISGKGTIYAERNVHIIDDITYKNPPDWPKDGSDPDMVKMNNLNADFLGVAARGSIVLGDYTTNDWQSNVARYIKPNFTSPYIDEDGSWFNADYTAYDGGKKTDNSNRRYYESTYSNAFFRNQVQRQQIRNLSGIYYTNHLFAGRMTAAEINGSIIMRDEAIVFNTSFQLNYDYRARKDGEEYIDIDLPKSARMIQLAWMYGSFDDNKDELDVMFGED